MQEEDVFDEKIENWDNNFLSAAVGTLRPLCRPLECCAVIAEVAGWIHMMLPITEKQNRLNSTMIPHHAEVYKYYRHYHLYAANLEMGHPLPNV